MELFKKLKRYKGFKVIRYTLDYDKNIMKLEHNFDTIIKLASYIHSLKNHIKIQILNSNGKNKIYEGDVYYLIENTPIEINKEIYSNL